MSRYKINKRIIIAAMVILLCLVSITGATLALFTSSSDGTIGINTTSGDLEVDIVDTSPQQNSLVGKVLNFQTTAAQDEVLFEPGACFYTEGFCVKNKGSIPINFIVYVSEDNTVSEDFDDAFDVWITEDPTNMDAAVRMQDFDGRLEVGQSSKVLYLVFRMKETAGNEFQDRTFTGVGITVCAVQGNGYIHDSALDNAHHKEGNVDNVGTN